MKSETKHLLLTKLGIGIALSAFPIVWYLGTVQGIMVAVLLGMLMAGSALWGYGYGWLSAHGGSE